MSNYGSSTGTTQPSIPVVPRTQIGRYAGLSMHFATLADLNTAIAAERANIAGVGGIWPDGQPVAVAGEGVTRRWNASGQHCRNVSMGGGKVILLASDSSAIGPTTGAPTSDTGADGDAAYDHAANALWRKAAGAWTTTEAVSDSIASKPTNLGVVANQAAMLALTNAKLGDFCFRADIGASPGAKHELTVAGGYATAANWRLVGPVKAATGSTANIPAGTLLQNPADGLLRGQSKGDGTEQTLNGAVRGIVGNRNHFPMYYQTEANTVINQRIKRTVSRNAGWSQIQLTYANFYMLGAEYPTTAAFTLRVGIEYAGVFYPVTFAGVRDKVMASGGGDVVSDVVANLVLPPGATYYERVRRVSTTAGDPILVSGTADMCWGEWTFRGTDSSVDYTLGGEAGSGATGYFTMSGGNLTGLTGISGGAGYAGSSCPVYVCDPDKGVGTGSLVVNRTVTAGAVATAAFTAGFPISGYGPNTFPVYNLTGSDVQQRCYHACLVTGIPSIPAKSLVVVGDSNGSGYGASDSLGDDDRNYGLYERAFRNQVGIACLSFPSANITTWTTESNFPRCHAIIDQYITHALIQAMGNDIGGGIDVGVVMNNVKICAALWRSRKAAVSFATPVVRTTSTDAFISAGNQTPAANFQAGGPLDTLTNAIRWEWFGLTSDFGVFEARSATESTSTPNVWRSDGGLADTSDGSHPGQVRGLRICAASCGVPRI